MTWLLFILYLLIGVITFITIVLKDEYGYLYLFNPLIYAYVILLFPVVCIHISILKYKGKI